MSVMVVLRMEADPHKLEEHAGAHPDQMRAIIDSAKSHGVIAHRFYGGDGRVMVVDEWPDEQSFTSFFSETQDQIGPLMQAVGVTERPNPEFWHKLETHDEVGWGA